MKPIMQPFFYLFTLFILCFYGCKKETAFKTYAKPEITFTVNDSRLNEKIIHFVKDTVYVLATDLIRNSGQILIIDAGTLVKVSDALSIIINTGARIEAKGTVSEPIVFTSSADKGFPGFSGYQNDTEHSWFGIQIYGNYPGTIDNTSEGTGILNFVRIEFAGASKLNYNQLPSLLLQNVGKGTIVENVEVSYSVTTTSFDISGGNFNARNLISYSSGGTDFYLKDGYTGMLQNLLAYRHPYFSPQSSQFGLGETLSGLLISGSTTFPAISNLTVLGPDLQTGTNLKYFDTTSTGIFGSVVGSRVGALIVTGGQFHIANSLLMGFPKGGFYLDNGISAASLQNGVSDFTYSIVQSNDAKRAFYLTPNIYQQYASSDLKDFLVQPQFGNQLYYYTSQFMLTDPYNYDYNPDPFPQPGSPLLTGYNFDTPVFDDPFFKKVNYRGALGTDNWLAGWTNFIPLQTNYNN